MNDRENVGGTDRMLRVIVGLALMLCAATGKLGAWAWIGLVPFATGLLKFCPAYKIFGINTCCSTRDSEDGGRDQDKNSEGG